MKRLYSFLAAAVCAFAMAPAPALVAEGGDELEIIDCGAFNNYNTSHQYGPFNWLEYIVETRRDVNTCPYAVGVDAWVLGHPGGSASHTWDLFTASVRRPVLLPRYGVWQTTGAHWRILVGFWYNNGGTASHVNVREQQPDPAAQCAALGWEYYWNGSECVFTPGSPIIVDTGRDGYELTSLDNGVRFDLNADGVPELVAWTRRNSDDEFLAMDRNGNGRIDSGAELFGNRSPAYADRSEVAAMNGFEALKFAQGPTYGRSILDDRVDGRDAVFGRLLLWRDANHNGISETDELRAVAGSGLVAIGTDYKNKKRVDRHGNEFRQKGRLLWSDGTQEPVFDVWLVSRE